MAMLDPGPPQRDALPSISHLDFDKIRSEKNDHNRYSMMSGLSVSTAPLTSPTALYSGPPPPYSSAGSLSGSTHGLPGYISPPETNSRRSTRDEKESPTANKSLPSISEALRSAEMPPTSATSGSQPYGNPNPGSAPGSAIVQSFTDAPRGPGNPFSQPNVPNSALRSSLSSNPAVPDHSPVKAIPPPPVISDSRQPHQYGPPSSPRVNMSAPRPSSKIFTGYASQSEAPVFRSPFEPEPPRPGYPFPDFHAQSQPGRTPSVNNFHFEHNGKFDDQRNPFKPSTPVPYGETVKRHLDVFDAELALNEVSEASARTLDFSKVWIQRYHQSNHTSYFTDSLPGLADIEDMMRQSQKVMDSLAKIREVALMQQTVLNEQRARAAHGSQIEDDYHGLSEEYRQGGFPGGDAKKRRGKAAPPGRCHSCNRAETPEWRRGPDGARTLCNACGLHYAKLTRKMGASKAAVLTGSNLRPKSISETRP